MGIAQPGEIETVEQKQARILVVDDEMDIVAVLAEGLEYAGYTCVTAHSGEEALRCLGEESFDALLTDIHMPRMRGDELQRIARQYDPSLAVLLVTAASDLQAAVQCLNEGVFDYLTKPFELSDVVVRVSKALGRRNLLREQQRLIGMNLNYQATPEEQVGEQAERIRLMFQNALKTLSYALEAKDIYTQDHSQRVADIAVAIASGLRRSDTDFHERLHFAALLHDIGKIGVPEAVLNKPDGLTPEEREIIKRHPVIGETILRPLSLDPLILEVVRSHHEQWDGGGYPDGLRGSQIPFGARIVSVADTYDAMTSARSYRAGMPHEKALAILREGAGKQWDAQVVRQMLLAAATGKIDEIRMRSHLPNPTLPVRAAEPVKTQSLSGLPPGKPLPLNLAA